MSDHPLAHVDDALAVLGRLSREARRETCVDMTPPAVAKRLRRVSQLRALCLYLMQMGKSLRATAATRDELTKVEPGR